MNFQHLGCFALAFGLAALAGCKEKSAPSPVASPPSATTQKPDDDDDHDHGPGPHKGTIGEMSPKHLEFVVDHGTQEATIYLLAGDAKSPFAIKAKDGKIKLSIKEPMFEIEMMAQPNTGDAPGTSSRFVAKDPRFGKEQEFAGEVDVIDITKDPGTPYHGEFKEKPGHEHPMKK